MESATRTASTVASDVARAAAARNAVSLASIITRTVQRRLALSDRVSKTDDTPVTIADYAAQAVVVHALRAALGPVVIVGEESATHLREPGNEGLRAATLAAVREVWPDASEAEMLDTLDGGAGSVPSGGEPFWTLDPIDGTKGFIRGHQYAVCLALIEQGVPTLAAMACPNLSEDFDRPFTDPDPRGITVIAQRGEGLVWSPCDQPTIALRPMVRPTNSGPLRFCQSFDSTHSDHTTTARLVVSLNARGVRAARPEGLDSQAKYAVLARGQADVLVRKPANQRRDWIWDAAPGTLVAQCAGLTVTDLSGAPLDFSRGKLLENNYGVIVAEPRDHEVVRSELAAL